jgi:hypothetical protein
VSAGRLAIAMLGVVGFGVLTVVTSGVALTPTLLFDGPSYVELARHIRAHWFLPPPPVHLRPPLYPTAIALAGWVSGTDGLAAVVSLQAVAWLLVGPLVALWVYRVGGSLLAGCATGCLHYTLGESFMYVRLVYAETLTAALAVGAGFALSASMRGGARAGGWRWLAAALALAAAHARPVYQLLLPLYAAFAVAPQLPGAAAARRAIPFAAAAAVGLLPFYAVNAVVWGSPSFVPIAGYCLANYLGDQRLLGKFPPGLEAVEALYATRFAADPGKERIGWWEVAGDWARLVEARTGAAPGWGALEREMGATAVAVLSRNPGYYVRRWSETWVEFSTGPGAPVPGRWSPISLASAWWAFFWGRLAVWLPFLILALESANAAQRGRGEIVRLVPIATYLAVALANTAIEPWLGQSRYRAQVEVFLLIALGLAATLVWDRARAGRAGWRRPAGPA